MPMMKPDAVLVVGAGPLQAHAISTARTLGLLPLVTDRDSRAPGIALAERWYPCDTQDIAGHAALVRTIQNDYTLRGVITAGADAAPAVAAASAVAGVPGIPLEAAVWTHNKLLARQALDDAGLGAYQPRWTVNNGQEDTTGMTPDSLSFPVVVKPLEASASRGVSLVHRSQDMAAALAKARAYGYIVLIEECLTGTEHSAEMLLETSGTLLWFNIVDRMFRYDDGVPLEVGHVNPSCLTPDQWDAIGDMVFQAAEALGATWGPFKCDVMWTDDGPKILEVTARLSGGYDSQGTSLARELDPTLALIQMACELPIEAPLVRASGYAACAAAFPEPGHILYTPRDVAALTGHSILEEAYALAGPHAVVHILRHAGDVIEPYLHCATRSGFVIARGETYVEAWERASAGAQKLAEGFITETAL